MTTLVRITVWISCDHPDCVNELVIKAASKNVARDKVKEFSWTSRDDGDYCPQHSIVELSA